MTTHASSSRNALIFLIKTQGWADVVSGAQLACVSEGAFKAYLSRVENDGYLVRDDIRFVPTENFSSFAEMQTNTRPMRARHQGDYQREHAAQMRRAKLVRQMRGDLEMTRCAKVCGFHVSHWFRLERGRKRITEETLRRMCAAIRLLRGGDWWE